jgi:hypothetical protein
MECCINEDVLTFRRDQGAPFAERTRRENDVMLLAAVLCSFDV